ncbi:MAG TPA: glycine cleavage system aminomethyltransferase GcvT [Humidesulfovibrio sp.]|uniref:glycine cleavage system aminomethyltransferase GcvT n=1 Tax=Humidesulfovibrio sp. TaxID=2910988 RepID=UPI002BA145EB|nr:glycine cleavage system aminomethyltransferase GcvT [Humidesulfovibrio sp.]HWR03739.1 glycine cleavage system aminomethyltransferase GcvT [Humidesulfovibrio sp.]
MEILRQTPLTGWHKGKGAKMAAFAGFDMPIQYEGIIAEHNHTRQNAGIFDICHMGEFSLRGPGAKDALNTIVTQDLDTLAPGKCRYGFLLNEKAGIEDDLIIYCLDTDDYMLVVNGACEAGDFEHIRKQLPAGPAFTNISDATGKIDLQGPKSFEVLKDILGADFVSPGYFNFKRITWQGSPLIVSRTGYTGELGYELYQDSSKTPAMWDALAAHPLVKPVGLGARDTLRLEMGYPLYGQDLDTEHTPVEAGFGGLITKEKSFTGKAGLGAVRERLIALKLEGRRSARHYDTLHLPDGTQVGMVTSGSFAPSLGHCVALAYVAEAHADKTDFLVRTQRGDLEAKKAALPFNPGGTARMKLA